MGQEACPVITLPLYWAPRARPLSLALPLAAPSRPLDQCERVSVCVCVREVCVCVCQDGAQRTPQT